jgi:hypothetical protein
MLRKWLATALTPLGIAVIYLFVGALWILASDQLLAMLVGDPQRITPLQTAKGWFFVVVTAVLLYGLIRQGRAALLRSQAELLERARQLEVLRHEASEGRSRLQALIDTAPIGIAFYSAPDGNLVLSNRAAESIVGRLLAASLGAADSRGSHDAPSASDRRALPFSRPSIEPRPAGRDRPRRRGGLPSAVRPRGPRHNQRVSPSWHRRADCRQSRRLRGRHAGPGAGTAEAGVPVCGGPRAEDARHDDQGLTLSCSSGKGTRGTSPKTRR